MTSPKRGIALAIAIILMPICMLMMYLFVDKVLLSTQASSRERGRSQTFHMAEAGLALAYGAFQANNFAGLTHVYQNSALVPDTGADRLKMPTGAGQMVFSPDSEGWYAWRWSVADAPELAFADGVQSETIRFRIYSPAQGRWRIDCQAKLGAWETTHSEEGLLENNAEYAIYSAGDMEDLTKADAVNVTGRVHANGNLYLLPRFMTTCSPSLDATGHLTVLFLTFSKTLTDVVWPVVISAVPGVPAATLLHNPPPINCTIASDLVEAGGKIIRHTDAHGDQYASSGQTITSTGVVTISKGGPTGAPVEMAGGPKGTAFDSDNASWKATAMDTFGKVVRDGQLGSRVRDDFDPRIIAPDGYYYQQAQSNGLLIGPASSGSWLHPASFFNNAENRLVKVYDVDVAALAASSAWPVNGLIYSSGPIRLSNAEQLPGPLTVVSRATIYTRGNFNVDYPDPGAYASHQSKKQPAALVTTDRLYHLSSAWVDDVNPAPPVQTAVNDQDHPPIPPNQFPPHAAQPTRSGFAAGMDPYENQLIINADLVDGVPPINELNWVPDHNGVDNPYYSDVYYWPANVYGPNPPQKDRTYHGFRWQASVNCAAGSDCLLEEFHQLQMIMDEPNKWDSRAPYPPIPDSDFTPVTIVRTGSLMHLQCATMGEFTDAPPAWDAAVGVTPWLVKSYYCPWVRVFNSEPMFQPGEGQHLPAFAPNISTKTLWQISN